MIQIWCKIINSHGMTDEELEIIKGLSADQYHFAGVELEGATELLHCILPIESVPVVLDFLAMRQQEPEIVKATLQDGTQHEEFPSNEELFDSFFPDGDGQHQFYGWVI